MWSGQDPALDEVTEVLWALSDWFNQRAAAGPLNTDQPDCLWHLARFFRQRNVPDPFADMSMETEAEMFRAWALRSPVAPPPREGGPTTAGAHKLFEDDRVLYPFPDELFWREGDEGEWVGAGAPAWREVEER